MWQHSCAKLEVFGKQFSIIWNGLGDIWRKREKFSWLSNAIVEHADKTVFYKIKSARQLLSEDNTHQSRKLLII